MAGATITVQGATKKGLIRPPAPTPAEPWNFHERVEKRRGVITAAMKTDHWCKKTRAHFDRAIDQLKHLPVQSWSKPQPASNIGDHTYVIRFKDRTSAQLRIFGHFHANHHSFVMTFNGHEKDYVYYPTNYKELAKNFRERLEKSFDKETSPFEDLCSKCTDN